MKKSGHYEKKYFEWQKNVGAFGGWASSFFFQKYISKKHTVIDFGCGGGYLLEKLYCSKRIGIEPNEAALSTLMSKGITSLKSPEAALKKLGTNIADVIISNNALEHTLNPLKELIELKKLLKTGGIIHFLVPCDSINYKYSANDINHHLFSWSPQNLGNIFKEAGYNVCYVRPYIHKWPPYYKIFARLGWPIFNLICLFYGRIERSWYQVEIKATKPTE